MPDTTNRHGYTRAEAVDIARAVLPASKAAQIEALPLEPLALVLRTIDAVKVERDAERMAACPDAAGLADMALAGLLELSREPLNVARLSPAERQELRALAAVLVEALDVVALGDEHKGAA